MPPSRSVVKHSTTTARRFSVELKQISRRKRTPMHVRLLKANGLHVGSTVKIWFTPLIRVTEYGSHTNDERC
jgi:hypothetical protein